MGNVVGKTMVDIQEDEMKQRPLNKLSPIHCKPKQYKLSVPEHSKEISAPKTSPTSPTPIEKKIIPNKLPILTNNDPYNLTPIHSNSHMRAVSSTCRKLAVDFWSKHIDPLSMETRLEIAWSIYVGMLASDIEIQRCFNRQCKTIQNIEANSIKFIDMVGFVIRTMINEDNQQFINKTLAKLGILHENAGAKIEYYAVMLKEMHQTFELYFNQQYSHQIRFALDEIFTYSAQLMTGKDLKMSSKITDKSFLKSYDRCLRSNVGSDCLFRYLQQLWCDEMVMFLHLISKYKSTKYPQTRYMIAKYIVKTCIEENGNFALKHISVECKQKVLLKVSSYKRQYKKNNNLMMDLNCFRVIEKQIKDIIMKQYWKGFKKSMQKHIVDDIVCSDEYSKGLK